MNQVVTTLVAVADPTDGPVETVLYTIGFVIAIIALMRYNRKNYLEDQERKKKK